MENRRRFQRVQALLPIRLYFQGELKVIETLTKDLGFGGLRCLSPNPTPPKTPVSIELTLGFVEKPVTLRAKTAWLNKIPQSNQFYLGITFQDISESNTVLSSYINKSSPDKSS